MYRYGKLSIMRVFRTNRLSEFHFINIKYCIRISYLTQILQNTEYYYYGLLIYFYETLFLKKKNISAVR